MSTVKFTLTKFHPNDEEATTSDDTSMLNFAMTPKFRNRNSSFVSMQNLSDINIELQSPVLYESKSTSSIHKLNKHDKYSHIESKVKQYRMAIQEQGKHSKLTNLDKNRDKFNISKTQFDPWSRIDELEKDMALLMQNNTDLLNTIADLEIRLEDMRSQNFQLKLQSSILRTPVSRRALVPGMLNNGLKTPNFSRRGDMDSSSDSSSCTSSVFEDNVFPEEQNAIKEVVTDASGQGSEVLLQPPPNKPKRRSKSLGVFMQDAFKNIISCAKKSPDVRFSLKRSKKLKFKRRHSDEFMHSTFATRKSACNLKPPSKLINDNYATPKNVTVESIRNNFNSTKKILNSEKRQYKSTMNIGPSSDEAKLALEYANEIINVSERFKVRLQMAQN